MTGVLLLVLMPAKKQPGGEAVNSARYLIPSVSSATLPTISPCQPGCKIDHPVDSRREAIASHLVSNDKQQPLRFQQVSRNFAAIFGNLFHNRRVQPNIHGR
jgi:hypothetical protein